MPSYGMPDGSRTDDAQACLHAWDPVLDLARKVFDGFEVHSFDPRIVLVRLEEVRPGTTVLVERLDITVSTVMMLARKLGLVEKQ